MRHRRPSGRAWAGRRRGQLLGVLAVLPVLWVSVVAASAADVSFNRDVRTILSDHCFACHGPDEKTRKAGLRLDIGSEAHRVLKSGNRAIVPGDPGASALVARITTEDPDERMPPAGTKKPLTPVQVETLRRWLAEGGRYEGHWAYLVPAPTAPPAPTSAGWVRNDLDRFVLARLERDGLKPSGEAAKEKLLRRVSLDLTGLPPTVEEIDAFLADPADQAYEKVVDRLLASPHYGERMAQQWLDLARYGETQGYHHDRHRDQWHWRDWVINAFNANQPFDQFTTEQLAGDLLPQPSRDQLIATGFHRNEMTTSEGGALPEEYIVKYAVGRVDTTARVWLGTSMACAECHDHKYDPITQKDYYRFFAFFFDTPENGLDAEELNPSPRITLETPEQRARAEQLDREVAAMETASKVVLEAPRAEWDTAQVAWEERHRSNSVGGWRALSLANARVIRSGELRQGADGTIAWAGGGPGEGTVYELTFPLAGSDLNGIRLDALPDERVQGRGAGSGSGRDGAFLLSRIEASVRSQDPGREAIPGDPAVPESWLAVGPFPAASAKEAYDKEFGPERPFEPGAVYGDSQLRWRPVPPSESGHPDLRLAGKAGVTYLTRTLRVREPRITEALLAGADRARVWLNGRPLTVKATPRGGETNATGQHRVLLWLSAGENRLLVKAVHGDQGGDFTFGLLPDPVTSAPLEFTAAGADCHAGPHRAAGVLDAQPGTGWSVGTNATGPHAILLKTREAFGFRGGTELLVRLHFETDQSPALPGRFRVSATASPTLEEFLAYPDDVRAHLFTVPGSLDEAGRGTLRRFYRQTFVPEAGQLPALLAARKKERDDFRRSWASAMVMQAATPTRETHIRIRGNYADKGAKVEPGVPERLSPWREEFPRNRLGLARWLTHPEHPLTARVVVNRDWQRYFGTGLVKTAEDFGSQGEWPSHPELLDWLAGEFVRGGWNVKALQRLIVTSATYRQDTVVSREWLERDPENRLLGRGPRFRLDAENVRDLAMSVSGLLNPKIGGPSVFPYQPPGLWGQVAFEGTRDYVQAEGADNYRRGLYTYWRRSIPYASFTVFDAPSREVCTVRRPRTNTPLQALGLMNDPVYVEAARAFAQRILEHGGGSAAKRIEYAFRVALGRRPTAAENARLVAACEREFRRYAQDREAANRLIHVGASLPPVAVDIAELAAWTVLANTLLNLDEAITKG